MPTLNIKFEKNRINSEFNSCMFGQRIKIFWPLKFKFSNQNICLSTKSFHMRKNRETIIYMIAKCVQWIIYRKKKKKLNQGQYLIKNVAVSLLYVKQCIVILNTTEGSHHLIFDMQTHKLFSWSANSFHCWQKCCCTFTISAIIIRLFHLLMFFLRHIICDLIIHNQLWSVRLTLTELFLQYICYSTPAISWTSLRCLC
jgi:hypothetical protein